MKILLVGKTKSNQAQRVKSEAEIRGHKLDVCASNSLTIKAGPGYFTPEIQGFNILDYDLIYLMVVGDKLWEWFVVCDYLHKNYGIKIVEYKYIDPSYKVYFSSTAELVKQINAEIKFPKTGVFLNNNQVEEVVEGFEFPIVLKLSGVQRGTGISLCNSADEIHETVNSHPESKAYTIREFIPNNGDIRVFTVGYKAIGAMKRTPPEGDFRSNISVGGKGEAYELEANPEVREIAEKLSELNHTEIAGVDIMISKETKTPYVLEINRGPQFAGLEKYTGVNAAAKIIEYFETI